MKDQILEALREILLDGTLTVQTKVGRTPTYANSKLVGYKTSVETSVLMNGEIISEHLGEFDPVEVSDVL